MLIAAGIMLMISRKETQLKQEKEKHGSWLIYAVLSAVFASLTSILGKIGIQDIDSNLGTAIRTTVVLIMAWLMVFITGKQRQIRKTEKRSLPLSFCPVLPQEPPGSVITMLCSRARQVWLLLWIN